MGAREVQALTFDCNTTQHGKETLTFAMHTEKEKFSFAAVRVEVSFAQAEAVRHTPSPLSNPGGGQAQFDWGAVSGRDFERDSGTELLIYSTQKRNYPFQHRGKIPL